MLCKVYIIFIALGSISLVNAGNEEAKIVFYHGPTSNDSQKYELADASNILNHEKFNLNNKTVLYIHGFIETVNSLTVTKIVEAYIQDGTHNILILDWSTLASGLYPTAVRKANTLGPAVADAFIDLFDTGVNSDQVHIVGHSLGAHLAGHIASTITEKSQKRIKLQRITGLDPALPQYYPPIGGSTAINKHQAVFVDIIHTDGGGYGTPLSTGTVDFWPNRGIRIQPGCPRGIFLPLSDNDLCSHQRSVALWAESVANPNSKFYAAKDLSKSPKIQMGIGCPITSPGSYNLKTNKMPPYSLAD